MWNSLLEILLTPLKEEHQPILVLLFSTRPQDFIEVLPGYFLQKDKTVAEKMLLMRALAEGIEELASK
jgi:hypothetical protein